MGKYSYSKFEKKEIVSKNIDKELQTIKTNTITRKNSLKVTTSLMYLP